MRTSPLLPLAFFFLGCNPTSSTTDGGTNPDGGAPNTCPAPTGSGTMHGGSVNNDETWTAAGSPHVLPYDTSIYAKLTLEPCAVVRIASDKTITVNAKGSIVANGISGQPVTIEAQDAAKNWASIRFIGGTGHLAYTNVVNGGAPLNIVPDFQAALDVRSGNASATAPDPVLFVDHVTIRGSGTQGVYAHSAGTFTPDSHDLTITESKGFAMTIGPNLVENIPTGKYTGNAGDAFLMPDGLPEQIKWDVTMHDRGVPYYSGGSNQVGVTYVGSVTGTAVLTIEAGVKWAFKKDTGMLNVDQGGTPGRGVLVAKGEMGNPVIFSSDQDAPAAGDWIGIRMAGDDPRNRLDWVEIQYAGKLTVGSGSNSCQSLQQGQTHQGGALRVYHVPPANMITNTVFFESATNGLDRGWRDDLMPSFLGGNNQFMGVALCKETFPRDKNGACPMPTAPCP